MKWQDIFNIGIKLGRECDIRNDPDSGDFKEDYSDCTIINGDPGMDLKKIYVAVDIGVGELLLAGELNKRGAGIDGVISHHPLGLGAYRLTDVIDIQRYNWERYGVDHKTAVSIIDRMTEDENIDIRARNLLAVGSASKLLEIPVMCMHTALDNIVQDFFDKLLNSRSFTKLEDVYKKIDLIPECIKASVNGDGPFVLDNKMLKNPPGNIMIDMTGGVDPDPEIFKYLKKVNIGTLIAMHYGIENIKAIKKNNINTIICGHMACDSIGLNIYCDILEKNGLGIVPGSGFYRHRRSDVS